MTRYGIRILGIGLVLSAMVLACRREEGGWVVLAPPAEAAEAAGPTLEITGVVRRSGLEGGFFAIEGSDGVTYDPINLPPQFQKDGLPIEATARRQEGAMGIHQVGPMVELERIRVRN